MQNRKAQFVAVVSGLSLFIFSALALKHHRLCGDRELGLGHARDRWSPILFRCEEQPPFGSHPPFLQFVGGVFGLYAGSWLVAGVVYLACFGRLSRSWIVYVTIGMIIILSCLNYRGLTMG